MEEGNIKEHRNYLQLEEEKRKRARVVRSAVEGPLLRWISKAEEVTVLVDAPPQPVPQPVAGPSRNPQYPYVYPPAQSMQPNVPSYAPYPPAPLPPYYAPQSQHQGPSPPVTFVYHSFPTAPPPNAAPPLTAAATLMLAPLPKVEKVETVTKNYVVHETSQKEGASRPLWKDTMSAMFGDHIRWDELKVYTGKGRPLCTYMRFYNLLFFLTNLPSLARPKDTCAITGQAARYRDPRTGVPFASVRAYQTLTKVLEHEYVWSESLGCYVAARSDDKDVAADKGKQRVK